MHAYCHMDCKDPEVYASNRNMHSTWSLSVITRIEFGIRKERRRIQVEVLLFQLDLRLPS